jgi:zinc resistance-associated protein
MGRGDGEGWRGGEGRYGQGYGSGRGEGEGAGRGEGRGRMSQLSDTDRQAIFAARLAAVKAGLLLTPEQEKLWPALENAIREGMKLRQDWRARLQKEGQAANPVERMRRMGEMATARGAAMTRLADAAAPLYNSLSDDQKRRLQMFHRMGRGMGGGMGGMMGMMGGGMGRGEGMRGDMRGEGMRGGYGGRGEGMRGGGYHHRHHHDGGYNRRGSYDDRGDRRL